MTATLIKNLAFNPATGVFSADIVASISMYVDPVTHYMSKVFYYGLDFDGEVLASGVKAGTFSYSGSAVLSQGLHRLNFFAGNSKSGESVSWNADIHNYTLAASGQVIFGQDNSAGSKHVDYAFGSGYGDAFFLGQNDDYVEAFGGNDYIDGGTGADTMLGGSGDDIYIVDTFGDMVIERANEGRDTVESAINWALGQNVEDLKLTGTGYAAPHINGTGNALANLITGNDGNNVLSGLGGNDTLRGGAGLDQLFGGDGNDILDGGTFADRMEGGAGNDTYYVDNFRDSLVEAAGAGIDRVYSSIDFTLGDNVEHLTLTDAPSSLTGAPPVRATGNSLANEIAGNSVANTLQGLGGNDQLSGLGGNDRLEGGDGNDRLNGGLGQDTLIGGGGNDVFEFRSVKESPYGIGNADQVNDFSAGDRFDVSAIDANETVAGNQAFVFDTDGIFSAGEIRQQTAGNITILTFNTNNDPTPDMMITVVGNLTFNAGHFWL
ncbi:calcium-binding protein [Ensifer soli]|uniref:calcium-binding protein n=1 Tax=Ciceribacter sp. sgz301302 TaxID=3342379 RepID=UPI0035BA142F